MTSGGGARAPLADLGIVVTRPARQSAALVSALAALGARPIVFPAIVILPPDDPAPLAAVHARLPDYDLAFFVSANAAEFGAPPAWPARVRAFAPGPGTAEALHAVGVRDVRVPSTTMDSEGLLALPELAEVRGLRAIVFRGDGGREMLRDTLAARGAAVDVVACYRRAAPSGGEGLAQALRERRADVVTITSSEGLDNLWSLLGGDDRARLAALPLFAPHPRIVAHARSLGFDAHETAAGDAGLVAGLLEWRRANAPSRGSP